MNWQLVTSSIRSESDVVAARQRARQVAAALGFDSQDQVRIATAVSEVARNALGYGGGGKVEFAVDGTSSPQALLATVSDSGPGISNLATVLSGTYKSPTGMGLGLIGARRLMDDVIIDTGPERGTVVQLRKTFSRRARGIARSEMGAITESIARAAPRDAFSELREQNRELLEASELLRRQQEMLQAVNQELEETNRGVLALYAELEDRAAELRRANDARVRFHSNVSHELRTPIQSIVAIVQLLLDRTDGELTDEQERQLNFIRQASTVLSGMVDDLLDFAKAEAGRLDVSATTFSVPTLFGGLRGLLRPLRASAAVELVIDEPGQVPDLHTDESKLTQILRNLVSNALKFTSEGEVRIGVEWLPDDDVFVFTVSDTGIGIASENHDRVFDEFVQVPNKLQGRGKGTGLGLSLSRRLAELMGGSIELESELGRGATFHVTIPRRLGVVSDADGRVTAASDREFISRLLIVDDDPSWRYVMRQMLSESGIEIVEAEDGVAGLCAAEESRPDMIFADLAMPRMDGFGLLDELKRRPDLNGIPVYVMTSSIPTGRRQRRVARAAGVLEKGKLSREILAGLVKARSGSG